MRVLYVEDDPMNRSVVKDMLGVVGAEMIEAVDAECGLRLVDEADYSIVLMDLRMPGMDGLTAIEHIRARSDAKAGLPIIVVTADTSSDLRERCLARGADEVILKPIAMAKLLKTMTAMLSKPGADGRAMVA
jgi:CheY-like chemotaxis protein